MCTVGDTAVTMSMYPPDKVCTYLYYTHVVIQGDSIRGAKVETSWESFKLAAARYRYVKMGISFDHRYITAAKITTATNPLALLSSSNIRHFGVLNVITKHLDLLNIVMPMKPVLEEIKKQFNYSHTVIAIGSRDYSDQGFPTFSEIIKTAVDTFPVDTVIAIASVSSAPSRSECSAVPPNVLHTFEREKNPSLAKLWHLLERNATTKQTTTLGLSFEMGTLMYELSSEHNKLADAVYALCTATSLTSREALCGSGISIEDSKHKLPAPYLTYGSFPTGGNKKRVVFTDFKTTAADRFVNVSGGTGSTNLRSRVAWMLFNVHLEDTAQRCAVKPFEVEEKFCKVFLVAGHGC